jgi:membrane fusion protein (multidrug efflux system)
MEKKMARCNSLLTITVSFCLLTILSGCSSNSSASKGKPDGAEREKSLQVKAFSVEPKEVQRTVESVGSLFAYDEVAVSSEVDGRAEKVLVDVGDKVTKGQTLVEILPIEFKLSAEQQAAMVEQAKARIGLGDADAESGDPTKSAEVKKAAADLANAKQKFERTKELAAQGLLPKATYDQDEAAYKAAQASYDLAVQDIRNLQALLKNERATSQLADKKLRDTQILAPFDGYVKERDVTIGQYLKVQTPVMTIVNVDPLRVRLKVPEKMAAWIPVGEEVTIAVEAYPDRTFTGKISRINPSVDPQTRSFEAEALIENHQGLLKPGFFVKATVQSKKVEQVVYVPQKALTYAYGIYKVYTIQNNKLKEKEVRIGDRAGDDVEIVDGLSPKERIAIPVKEQELRDRASVQVVS